MKILPTWRGVGMTEAYKELVWTPEGFIVDPVTGEVIGVDDVEQRAEYRIYEAEDKLTKEHYEPKVWMLPNDPKLLELYHGALEVLQAHGIDSPNVRAELKRVVMEYVKERNVVRSWSKYEVAATVARRLGRKVPEIEQEILKVTTKMRHAKVTKLSRMKFVNIKVDRRREIKRLIEKACRELNLPYKAASIAFMILDRMSDFDISGKSERAVAGALIYLTSIIINDRKSMKEVRQAIGVTEVTIRKHIAWIARVAGIKLVYGGSRYTGITEVRLPPDLEEKIRSILS